MRLAFQLAHLLDAKNQRGIIKEICDRTNLERHQVAAFLKNRAKYISLDALAGLCDYLVEYHKADPKQLLGKLFAPEPDEFLDLLARRHYLEVCVGVRREEEGTERVWVMASDHYLNSRLVHELSGLGSSAGNEHPLPGLELRLVPAYRADDADRIKRDAREVYTQFVAHNDDRALVACGSIKSNVLVEMILAKSFRTQPFQPQDDVRAASERSCPIFFRYRDDDPHPPSCCGGLALARSKRSREPGIYFETAAKEWVCCPWDDAEHDVALVFYTHHVTLKRLELVMGGFSGRATRWLAELLGQLRTQFWPPTYENSELQIGAFLVKFGFDKSNAHARIELGRMAKVSPPTTDVVRLDDEVLKRRFESRRATAS